MGQLRDKPVPVLPNKRVRIQHNTNDMNLDSVHSAADDVDEEDPDNEKPAAAAESDQEATPESYNDAARDERWVQSRKDEVCRVEEQRRVACRSYTARSAAYQVKVCLSCQEGLDRQSGQAKVETRDTRILSAGGY